MTESRPTLRLGDESRMVERLQHLLIAEGSPLIADGEFGARTQSQVRAFQRRLGLKVDGVVGPGTWSALEAAQAARAGDDVEEWGWGAKERTEPPEAPPKPDFGPIVGNHGRQQMFGKFKFAPAATPNNPEAIRFLDDWPEKNIVTVEIPQLTRIPGIWIGSGDDKRIVGAGPKSGHVSVHRLVAESAKSLWRAWDEAGLIDRIITWAGWWSPRFIRGSRSVLSNHAFATAFDINAPWNGLSREPAKPGERGCVWELVPLANEHGWYWGGHFSRRDGMHFEYAGHEYVYDPTEDSRP